MDGFGGPVHVGRTRVADQSGEFGSRASKALYFKRREGIARDLLIEMDAHKFQVVVMGKKSFHERKPFLMGSHAAKILQNAKGVILCLVD